MTTVATASAYEDLVCMLPKVGGERGKVAIQEDDFAKLAHKAFRDKELSREEYRKLMNAFRSRISGYIDQRSGLSAKLDRRTLGDFALWINDQTAREEFLMSSWADMALSVGLFKSIRYEEHGCDHLGRVLLYPSKQGKMADYKIFVEGGKIIPDGEHLLEVKFDPSIKKFTLKQADVESYLQQKCYLLCVLTDSVMVGPNGKANAVEEYHLPKGKTYWCLLSPEALKRLYLTGASNDRFEMGGKRGIQLTDREFGDVFLLEVWGECRQHDGLARPWELNA